MPRPRPQPFTMSTALHVIDAAPNQRLRTWLQLGLYAGLRRHEIAKIRGADVTETDVFVFGKGGHAHVIPTHPILWQVAQDMPRDYWFPSPQQDRPHISGSLVSWLVAQHFREHGHSGSIHRMRATYGTSLLRAGVNLRVIQDLMRHRSLASTEHYLGVDAEERTTAIRLLAA